MHSIRLSVIIFTVTRWGGYRRGEGRRRGMGRERRMGRRGRRRGVDKRRLGKAYRRG
jgi:hypothetical protein